MTELVLSEITRMAPGFCIMGLEPCASGFRSVRPGPPKGHAWMPPFNYHRGDKLRFTLSEAPITRPHVEDRRSAGVMERTGRVSEEELLAMLRKAEVAGSLRDLFGCRVMLKRRGAFVIGKLGKRSVCGVHARKIRVHLDAGELRASVVLPSGETLPDLPVVDRSWLRFTQEALLSIQGANQAQRLNRYLAERFQGEAAESRGSLVRIGLTRPVPNACWLMVDTLFPFPRKSWLNEVRNL
jgi:hypothetical protein